MPRLALVGDSICQPTGFGTQLREIAAYFTETFGWNVCSVYDNSIEPVLPKVPGVEMVPCSYQSLRAEMDAAFRKWRPDHILYMGPYYRTTSSLQIRSQWENARVSAYVICEGGALGKHFLDRIENIPKENLIYLTKSYAELWGNKKSDNVIPHVVPPAFRNLGPSVNPDQVRTTFGLSRLPANALTTVYVERNDIRKRWDLLFYILKQLPKLHLIAHTNPDGAPTTPVPSYDLRQLASYFGVSRRVHFTDRSRQYSSQEIAELYQFSDFRICPSAAEGFGLGLIEAGAAGCINVSNAFFGAQDVAVCEEELVTPAHPYSSHSCTLWDEADCDAIVEEVSSLMTDRSGLKAKQAARRKLYLRRYNPDNVFVTLRDRLMRSPVRADLSPHNYRKKLAGTCEVLSAHYHLPLVDADCTNDNLLNAIASTGEIPVGCRLTSRHDVESDFAIVPVDKAPEGVGIILTRLSGRKSSFSDQDIKKLNAYFRHFKVLVINNQLSLKWGVATPARMPLEVFEGFTYNDEITAQISRHLNWESLLIYERD